MPARVLLRLQSFVRSAARPLGLLLILASLGPALAQEAGTRDEKAAPPADAALLSRPAKDLFSRQTKPVPLAARSIGLKRYAHLTPV